MWGYTSRCGARQTSGIVRGALLAARLAPASPGARNPARRSRGRCRRMSMAARGFILQASYRVTSAARRRAHARRASVRPAGQAASRFWCGTIGSARTSTCAPPMLARAPRVKALPLPQPVDKRTFAGEPGVPRRRRGALGRAALARQAARRRDRDLRSRRPLRLALLDRARHQGRLRDRRRLDARRRRPRCSTIRMLRPADVQIEPRVLSFDIETDAQGRASAGDIVVSAWESTRCSSSTAATGRCPSEPSAARTRRAALEAFAARVRAARSGRAHRLESHRFRSHACSSGSRRA